jgi:hypothetical protein
MWGNERCRTRSSFFQITIFSVQWKNEEERDGVPSPAAHDRYKELDEALLGAVLRTPGFPVAQQLALVLSWDRVDIARTQLFVYGQEWPEGKYISHSLVDTIRHLQ